MIYCILPNSMVCGLHYYYICSCVILNNCGYRSEVSFSLLAMRATHRLSMFVYLSVQVSRRLALYSYNCSFYSGYILSSHTCTLMPKRDQSYIFVSRLALRRKNGKMCRRTTSIQNRSNKQFITKAD